MTVLKQIKIMVFELQKSPLGAYDTGLRKPKTSSSSWRLWSKFWSSRNLEQLNSYDCSAAPFKLNCSNRKWYTASNKIQLNIRYQIHLLTIRSYHWGLELWRFGFCRKWEICWAQTESAVQKSTSSNLLEGEIDIAFKEAWNRGLS